MERKDSWITRITEFVVPVRCVAQRFQTVKGRSLNITKNIVIVNTTEENRNFVFKFEFYRDPQLSRIIRPGESINTGEAIVGWLSLLDLH